MGKRKLRRRGFNTRMSPRFPQEPDPTLKLRAEVKFTPKQTKALGQMVTLAQRKAFKEAAEAVRNACKQCNRPIKTRVIGRVVRDGQSLPVHQLDDNLIECPNCTPATDAIRALAKEQTDD